VEAEDEDDEEVKVVDALVLMLRLVKDKVEVEVVLGSGREVEVDVGVWLVEVGVYCEVDKDVVVDEAPLKDHVPPYISPITEGSPPDKAANKSSVRSKSPYAHPTH